MALLKCKKCGKKAKVNDKHIGRKAKCPDCGENVKILSVAKTQPQPKQVPAKLETAKVKHKICDVCLGAFNESEFEDHVNTCMEEMKICSVCNLRFAESVFEQHLCYPEQLLPNGVESGESEKVKSQIHSDQAEEELLPSLEILSDESPILDKATKQCPFCSEEILATAKKCKHCGEFLSGGDKNGNKDAIFQTNIQKTQNNTLSGQKDGTGGCLTLIGCTGIAYFAFIYDTTVNDVHNIGLLNNRLIGIIVACGLMLCGILYEIFNKKQ